jgi:PAS domain S-box-containing protein
MDVDDPNQTGRNFEDEPIFLAAILDAAKELLVVILDTEGRIVHFNRACKEHTGYSLEEVRGRRMWDFLLLPEEVSSVRPIFQEVVGGTPNQHENYWLTKDGRSILISWSNSAVRRGGVVQYVIGTGIDVTDRESAKHQVRESEANVRAILETAAQAILAVDRSGRIVMANPAAERMYSYGAGELMRLPLETLMPERYRERHAAHLEGWFSQPHSRMMNAGVELSCLRKDGSEFAAEASLSHIDTPAGRLGVAFVSDITERKKNEQALEDYQQQLQRLTASLIAAQESGNRELARELHDVFSQELAAVGMEISSLKEQAQNEQALEDYQQQLQRLTASLIAAQESGNRELARELHDVFSQELTAVGMKISSLKEQARSGGELAERLSDLGKKISRLAREMHRTSRELHPAILEELGLEPALRQECEAFQERSGIPTRFTEGHVPAGLAKEVASCLYRVAQESLRNIAKHASGADTVRVSLSGGSEGITLCIEDTGDGFDLDKALKKGGLGLISMEERVRLVNGKLTIQSQPGKGTKVTAFCAISQREQT